MKNQKSGKQKDKGELALINVLAIGKGNNQIENLTN